MNNDLNGDVLDDVDRISGRYHDMRWMFFISPPLSESFWVGRISSNNDLNDDDVDAVDDVDRISGRYHDMRWMYAAAVVH